MNKERFIIWQWSPSFPRKKTQAYQCITVICLIAATQNLGPLRVHSSGSSTSKNVLLREKQEHITWSVINISWLNWNDCHEHCWGLRISTPPNLYYLLPVSFISAVNFFIIWNIWVQFLLQIVSSIFYGKTELMSNHYKQFRTRIEWVHISKPIKNIFVPSPIDELLWNSLTKVCSLLEWCFVISIEVSSDHSQLRCTGFCWKSLAWERLTLTLLKSVHY